MAAYNPVAYIHVWPVQAVIWRRRDALKEIGDVCALEGMKPTLRRIRGSLAQPNNVLPELLSVGLVEIKPHMPGDWETSRDDTILRCILPLVTNPFVLTHIGNVSAHFPVGNLNWIDHRQPVSTVNQGDYPHVHLVIDIAAPVPYLDKTDGTA